MPTLVLLFEFKITVICHCDFTMTNVRLWEKKFIWFQFKLFPLKAKQNYSYFECRIVEF